MRSCYKLKMTQLHFQGSATLRSQLSGLWAGLLFLSIGAVFLFAGLSYLNEDRRFAREGREAIGIVLEKKLHEASDTADTSYQISYSFAAGNRRFGGRDTVDVDQWDRLKPGDPIRIQYIVSAPGINRLSGDSYWLAGLVFAVIGSVFCPLGAVLVGAWWRGAAGRQPAGQTAAVLHPIRSPLLGAIVNPAAVFGAAMLIIGGVMLPASVWSIRREHEFDANGKTAVGIILTKSVHRDTDWRHNRQTDYTVRYRFRTEVGLTVENSQDVSYRRWHSIRERDAVDVIYLPSHPSANRLAVNHPITGFWIGTVLGALLCCAGAPLLGYGLSGAMRTWRRRHRRASPARRS